MATFMSPPARERKAFVHWSSPFGHALVPASDSGLAWAQEAEEITHCHPACLNWNKWLQHLSTLEDVGGYWFSHAKMGPSPVQLMPFILWCNGTGYLFVPENEEGHAWIAEAERIMNLPDSQKSVVLWDCHILLLSDIGGVWL